MLWVDTLAVPCYIGIGDKENGKDLVPFVVSCCVVAVSSCALCGVRRKKMKTKRKIPSLATLMKWMNDGVAKATDGCQVEPDGKCEHGKPSWLLVLGYI